MYCPECGFDAGDAKFCPECGTQLDQVRAAVRGGGSAAAPSAAPKTTGKSGGAARAAGGATTGAAARPPRDPDLGPARAKAPRPQTSGMRPLHLWIGVAVVAVAVVATWLILTNHGTSSSANGAPVASNTIGAYADLVARADNHFQQGMNLISGGNMGSAAPYFVAAGQEYGAAWAQQSTDPAVAGNYATSVFYAGDPQGALILANKALKLHPTGQLLQTILFNKGNYLAMIGRQQVTSGKAVEGKKSLTAAKASYAAAIKVDTKSTLAQSAQTAIAGLSKTTPSSPVASPSP